jgi:hypothetical protein
MQRPTVAKTRIGSKLCSFDIGQLRNRESASIRLSAKLLELRERVRQAQLSNEETGSNRDCAPWLTRMMGRCSTQHELALHSLVPLFT